MSSQIYFDECLSRMAQLPEQSVDMVLCDLPYGLLDCKWDSVIPLAALWAAYDRLIKPHSAVVLTCNQPFTSALVMSKPKWFRHEWTWDKIQSTGFQLTKHKPLMRHESIEVFGRESVKYRPVMTRLLRPRTSSTRAVEKSSMSSPLTGGDDLKARKYFGAFPQSILAYEKDRVAVGAGHPTQKPVALLEYLIETYTVEGDTVLDNTMGSGSTGVACANLNRNFIGIERDEHWFAVARKRIADAEGRPRQPSMLPRLDVEDAVKILEEIDPALYAAMEANDGTEPSEEDEAIDEVFG